MARTETSAHLLLRITEVAALLGLGRSTVYELVQRGELPVKDVGRAIRVPAAALQRWLECQMVEADELR